MLGFNSYATIYPASAQTTRFTTNNHWELDTVTFVGTVVDGTNVAVSTGSGQANGQITLTGKRFLVWPIMRCVTNEGYLWMSTTDTGGTGLTQESGAGIGGPAFLDSNASDICPTSGGPVFILDATGGAITFEFRFVGNSNPVSLDGEVYCFPLSDATV